MSNLTVADFEAWLGRYKAAWEARDPAAAAAIFTEDCEYYWTPFDPPAKGRAGVAAAWEGAVRGQKDVTFTSRVLAVEGARGIAHWHTRLTAVPGGEPVEFDGIFVTEFVGGGQCRIFREWWHLRGKPA